LAYNLIANFLEAIATLDKILRGYWQLCANIENTHPWLEVCQYPLILAKGYSLSSEAVDRVSDNLGRHYQKGAPFINKEAIFSDLSKKDQRFSSYFLCPNVQFIIYSTLIWDFPFRWN
jgi:hypothetical protein